MIIPKGNVAELQLADKHGGGLHDAGADVVEVLVVFFVLLPTFQTLRRYYSI
jgi:hypothetical protein